MKSLRLVPIVFVVFPLLSALSCQRYTGDKQIVNERDTYFPIKQFVLDQVQMYSGAPQSLYRIIYLDGEKDTTILNNLNTDWTPVFQAFAETDISRPELTGQYDFAIINDETTGGRGLIYTAKDPKLLTKTLQINTDPSNNKITSIYIETEKHDFFGSVKKKLLYVPAHIIQIQESNHNLLGRAQNLRVEYRYMGEDDVEQI